MRTFRVSAKLESSHHEGWCTNKVCKYQCIEETTHEVRIAAGAAVPTDLAGFAPLLQAPSSIAARREMIYDYECGLSDMSAKAELGKHDFRYTVTAAAEVMSTEGVIFECPVGAAADGAFLRVSRENATGSLLRVHFVNADRTAEVDIPATVRVVDDVLKFPIVPSSRDARSILLGSSDQYAVYLGDRLLTRFTGVRAWQFTSAATIAAITEG